ncbi:MAG: PKD domain-containing protein [Bacteroidetes bacterium]|nr:PKD domain-containing protein [Bacteroidota bacterium]
MTKAGIKYIYILLFTLAAYSFSAQCLLKEVPLADRINTSELIIEGKVISQSSFWDAGHRMIYTSNTLEIYKVFKGITTGSAINIITEGGTVGLDRVTVSSGLELEIGQVGLFTCSSNVSAAPVDNNDPYPDYAVYAGMQGFIRYDPLSATAADPFRVYYNVTTTFYNVITNQTQQAFSVIKPFDLTSYFKSAVKTAAAPVISSFSPSVISAGTKSQLTITGSGFGVTQSSGVVGFKNSDNGGSNYINPLASQYISWSDNQIVVEVPSKAGTGTIQVTRGSSATSSSTLTINYAELNVNYDDGNGIEAYLTDHVNSNGSGGYTWQMNTAFSANAAANASFIRALGTWRCNTGINWTIGSTTAINSHANDNTNLVAFDDNDPLPAGVLGTCYTYWAGCSSGGLVWYVKEHDLVFDNGNNISPQTWQFGPALPSSGQYDFESIASHELGHGRQLGHVINSTAILNYAISNGQYRRILSANDIAGGNDIQSRSMVANGCGPGAMINYTTCTPVADFSANKTKICIGDTVKFTDQSTRQPTSWLWSFSGGTPSTSTLQNPSVKYNSSGTYSVSLTATNSSGSATQSFNNYITVGTPPVVTASSTDISCNGSNNGSAVISSTGGTSPYTYQWNNGLTTATISNLNAAIYTCTVSDASNCKIVKTISITQPASPVTISSIIISNEACGRGDGTLTATATGGTGGLTYSWSNGVIGPTANNLSAATYTLVVTDSKGCTASSASTINNITGPSLSTFVSNAINCYGQTGSVTLLITSGTGPYTYSWSSGSSGTTSLTSAVFNSITAGSYTVSVSDKNNCSATASVSLTAPAALTANLSGVDVICYAGNNGSATISTNGGTGPYTYLWNIGASTNSISNLVAATYTCTVSDQKNCNLVSTITITQPAAAVSINSITSVNETCGRGDGTLTATATGGIGGLTYSWSNGVTGPTANNLSAATYTLVVTDSKSCTASSASTINNITGPSLSTFVSNVINCYGQTGSITLLITSGTGPYTYSWSSGSSGTTSLTSAVFNSITAGSYTVSVSDKNNCSATASVSLTAPAALTANLSGVDVICYAGSNGSATINPHGGTGPYTYLWNIGASTNSISNLVAATYTCTVSDQKNCNLVSTITITQPAAAVSINSITSVNEVCGGGNGTLTATANGGTGGLTYSWSNGVTGPTANNLSAATYTLIVTDSQNCSASSLTTLNNISGPGLTGMVTQSIICYGSTGAITANISGGSSPYAYSWSNGSSGTAISSLILLENLLAGSYSLVVTDNNNCSSTITIPLTQPTALSASITSQNVLCSPVTNGSATVTAQGGSPGYVYIWSNGSSGTTISDLIAANYTITVIDSKACTYSSTVIITETNTIKIDSITPTPSSCGLNNGSALASVSGGNGTLTYSWSAGGTSPTSDNLSAGIYEITVSDALGCIRSQSIMLKDSLAPTIDSLKQTNILCKGSSTGSAVVSATGTSALTYSWNTGALGQTINNIAAGGFTVTVTDASGCRTLGTGTITEPATALLINNIIITNETCGKSNGNATAIVSTGSGGLTYSWSNGSSDQAITDLSANTYTLVITDNNNCTSSSIIAITDSPAPVAALSISSGINCQGQVGSLSAVISGGAVPFGYAWSNGTTGSTSATTLILNNVVANSYTLTVTDANNCTSSTAISITEPTVLTAAITPVHILCNGSATGSAAITAAGGTSGYMFSWSNGTNGVTSVNLSASSYFVTVTDSKGCTLTKSVTITEPNAISNPTFIIKNTTCGSTDNGSAIASSAGGSGTLTYSWSNGSNDQTASGLSAGTYTLTITDSNNCIKTNSITISNSLPPLTSASISNAISCNGQTGSLTVNISDGAGPFDYVWSDGTNGSTSASILILNNAVSNSYTLTVTDANNCTSSTSISITEPSLISASINTVNLLCNGAATGSAAVAATGGTPGYVFSWSNGTSGVTAANLAAANYSVTVTDSQGCTLMRSIAITEPNGISKPTFIVSNTTCGLNNGSVTASSAGGTGMLSYNWSNGTIGQTASGLSVGTYTLSVTDAYNCIKTSTIAITNIFGPVVTTSVSTAINCNGQTGSVSASITGGTPPYAYVWSEGTAGSTISPFAVLNNATANSYIVTITDANNCVASSIVSLTEPSALVLTIASTNVSCNGSENGTAGVMVSGGTPAYITSWSNGFSGSVATNLAAANYTVTITDSKGCKKTSTVTLTEPNAISTPVFSTTNTTCGANNGNAIASSAGGSGTLTYNWSEGTKGTTVSNLTVGCFTLTVTDMNSCTKTGSTCISDVSIGDVTIAVDNVNCIGDSTGKATASIAGGLTGYSFTWSNGSTNYFAEKLLSGNYVLTISDSNNCKSINIVSIAQPAKTTINFTITKITCSQNNGSVVAVAGGGTGTFTYSWSTGAFGQTISNLSAGSYTLTTTDSNACNSTAEAVVSNSLCVWPGDADYSGIANVYDILALGLGYGDQGPVRPGSTINWVGQAANDWTNNLPNTIINEKHADCNGDGVINSDDTTAIIKNYALSHSLKLAKPDYISGTPELTFGFPVDTTLAGTKLNVPVILGSATNQVNIYGLAFSVYYDPKIVDSTQIKFTANNSWLGINGSNLIFITKNFGSIGRMDIGVTRINHQNISNDGAIGELTIPIKSSMPDLPVQKYHTLFISDSQIRAVSSDGSDISINPGKDSVVVEMPDVIGIAKHNKSDEIRLFPNPASDIINIELNNISVKEMRLINILGETFWQSNGIMNNKITIDTEPFPSGLYYLSIISVQEKAVVQVNIIK